ncbi:Tricyclene synthase tps4, chloroplastic [Stylosanthes scabra]|uniref:Tricyclene synthase tps4, chloroplastic n=1 Tax=Stylosanthes scabra TaxID=79078 RepID=A0ABU6YV60_9FABA|nr:Tricyclene synthase tps4, chloroplastic [Stylosanthes scabra]
MRENGVSEECAHKYINNLLDETWKKMNKDRVTNSPFSNSLTETAMNLARISQCTYQYGDAHGAPDASAKNRIRSLIIEPLVL